MNRHGFSTAAWLSPLLVLIAAFVVALSGAGGVAGAVRAGGAAAFHGFVPGVMHRTLQRPGFAGQAELAFLVVAGAALVMTLARATMVQATAAVAALIAVAIGASWTAAREARIFLDYLYPSLVLALMFAAGALARLAASGERKHLKDAFGHRLPALAMREILERPTRLALGGETRVMTYLSCGIRDLAELADRFASDAPGFAHLVRRVMAPLTEAVLESGGTLDVVAPGCVTAFFNAPLDDPDHAVHACACALRMTERMEALNRARTQERGADGAPAVPIEIGIGVNTGPLIAGDFGGQPPLDYGVAGRTAERARELKDLSGNYGFPIIVGEATRASAEQRLAFLQVDVSLPAGNEPAAPVFAVLGNQQMRSSPKFKALQTFHRCIFEAFVAQDWNKTRELVAQCRALSGASQRLYALYLDRIARYEADASDEAANGKIRSAST